MVRTWWYSLAGFAIGFPLACLLIRIAASGQQRSDTTAAIIFLGSFLAAAGAITGALIGGVADLLAFLKKKDETPTNTRVEPDSASPAR